MDFIKERIKTTYENPRGFSIRFLFTKFSA